MKIQENRIFNDKMEMGDLGTTGGSFLMALRSDMRRSWADEEAIPTKAPGLTTIS